MADPKRVARALQYQQDKPAWWDAVPVADAPGTVRTPTPQEMSWLDRLNELSAGAGKGIESQLEGYKNMVLHPVDTAKQMYQSGKAVVQDPSLLVKGLQAMGERAMGSPQGFGEVVGENINPRNLLRNLARPSIEELTVYHGTPHRFPATERNPLGEFDASKIGTGEGAQAYGHGLYLAENPKVAGGYRNVLSDTLEVVGNADPLEKRAAQMALTFGDNTPEGALKWLSKFEEKGAAHTAPAMTPELISKVKQKFENGTFKQGGSLYHVDLPDEMIDRMLRFEMPLNEMPDDVAKLINPIREQLAKQPNPSLFANLKTVGDVIQYSNAAGLKPHEILQKAGIPGIKYLDAGSRGQGGSGTRNFVIFPGEERNLKILERK